MKIYLFVMALVSFSCVNRSLVNNTIDYPKSTGDSLGMEREYIVGLWKVDSIYHDKKMRKIKAFYFFGADSTFMYSPDSTVKNNLIAGYKYFVSNDTIFTMDTQEEENFIYKEETKVIISLPENKMRFKSVNGDESFLTRIRK